MLISWSNIVGKPMTGTPHDRAWYTVPLPPCETTTSLTAISASPGAYFAMNTLEGGFGISASPPVVMSTWNSVFPKTRTASSKNFVSPVEPIVKYIVGRPGCSFQDQDGRPGFASPSSG